MENKENNNQVQKNDDELWDEMMNNPENAIFFENLEKQVEKAIQNQELKDDDFDN